MKLKKYKVTISYGAKVIEEYVEAIRDSAHPDGLAFDAAEDAREAISVVVTEVIDNA